MATSASQYWNKRKLRDAAHKAAVAERARDAYKLTHPTENLCRLCGHKLTPYGGCYSPIGACSNAYTD